MRERVAGFLLAPFVVILTAIVITIGWLLGMRVKITRDGHVVGYLRWFHLSRIKSK